MVDICWYSNLWVKIWRWVKIKDLGYHILKCLFFSMNHPIITVPNFDSYPYPENGRTPSQDLIPRDIKIKIEIQRMFPWFSHWFSSWFSHGFSHWLPPFLEDFPARHPQPSATGAVGAALRGLRPSHVRGVSGAPCGGIERDYSWGFPWIFDICMEYLMDIWWIYDICMEYWMRVLFLMRKKTWDN